MILNKDINESHEDFIHKVVQALGEHYECVQVFVHNTTEEGGIDAYQSGTGNLWAREMQVTQFLEESIEIDLEDDEE